MVFIEQGLGFCADTPAGREALASLTVATLYRHVESDHHDAPALQAVTPVTWDAIAALTETHSPCLSWY
ncbi:MAG: hypothetical protein LAT61_05260 [Alcanivorax sp.]|nr:hypothetical protein [Alcanivorax sp.]